MRQAEITGDANEMAALRLAILDKAGDNTGNSIAVGRSVGRPSLAACRP